MKKHISKYKKSSQPLSFEKIDWEKAGKIFNADKKLILEQLKKTDERYPSSAELLKILAGGMFIALSFVFPALPLAIAPFIIDGRKYKRYRLHQTVDRLKRQKLVEIIDKDGQTLVKITERGKIRALQYKIDDIKIDKKKVWDRKWRIVIFDIPEKHKSMRDIFRLRLKKLGFYLLQDSVWVHPYPCFDQVEFLRQIYAVGINVRYIIADRIENAEDLVSHYGLNPS